ncbi:hypothetical protein ACFSHT_05295 [Paraburkholderia silviterrae]|uniref:hypothetical protein n=1 Tax=Paraburkholderia silviterrae TaxID=2528715 RepID=UPI001F0DA907|nr:hypothetical protein [Paraburkholderia silviterrae]
MFFHTGTTALKNEHNATPYYLVLRTDCPPYVLDVDHRILRREASQLLRAFAKARVTPTSIAGDAWNDFSGSESISLPERMDVQAYALVCGAESEHQLRLLASL